MGGMGPLATVDMMRKIIAHTPAKTEQEHLHIIVDNYPQIPERMAAILGDGTDPVPYMIRSAKLLQRAGADLLVIACNSAHYFLPAIQEKIDIPILDMPNETALYMKQLNFYKVGLLATDATLRKKLYHKPFQSRGITVIEPTSNMQELLMRGISFIKKGELEMGTEYLAKVAHVLFQSGVEAIVAGCTEVALVLQSTESMEVIDPTDIVTQSVVKEACN